MQNPFPLTRAIQKEEKNHRLARRAHIVFAVHLLHSFANGVDTDADTGHVCTNRTLSFRSFTNCTLVK